MAKFFDRASMRTGSIRNAAVRTTAVRTVAVRRAAQTVLETLESRRLLSAGSPDTSFGNGGIVTTSFNAPTNDLVESAIQLHSGKSLVAGSSDARQVIARYNANGSRDTTFGNGGYVVVDGSVLSQISSIKEEGDNKIVASGTLDGTAAVARFNADGSVDSSFGSGGVTTISTIGAQAIDLAFDSGSIVTLGANNGDFAVAELNSDGSINSGFGDGSGVASIDFGSGQNTPDVIAVDGSSIYVAGSSLQTLIIGGQPQQNESVAIAKLQSNGQLDASFGSGGEFTHNLIFGDATDATPASIQILGNGNVLLGGTTSDQLFVMEVTSTGQVDNFFGNGVTDEFPNAGDGYYVYQPAGSTDNAGFGATTDASGNIYLVGQTDQNAAITKFTAQGQPDLSFGTSANAQVQENFGGLSAYRAAWANGNQVQVVGNEASRPSADSDFVQNVYNSDGTSASDFAIDGFTGPQSSAARSVVQQADGKLVAAGTTNNNGTTVIAIARYNADGSLDASFGNGGEVVSNVAVQDVDGVVVTPDGRILVGFTNFNGNDTDLAVASFNASGSLNTGFGDNGVSIHVDPNTTDQLVSVGISPTGDAVYLAGQSGDLNTGDLNFEIDSIDSASGAGLHSSSIDLGNDPASGFSTDELTAMSVQSNGSILLAGFSLDSQGNPDIALARVSSDLSLDSSYGHGGIVIDSIGGVDEPMSVATDSAGNAFVAVAAIDPDSGTITESVVKYDPSGTRVTSGFGDANGLGTFNLGDMFTVTGMSVGSDGSITLGGTVTHNDTGTTSDGVVRLTAAGNLDANFGNGGTTDVTVNDSSDAPGFTVQSDGNIVLAGSSDSDFALVRITGASQVQPPPPPVANAGPDQSVNEGSAAHFDGSASTGDQLSYSWDLNGDGIFGDANTPNASYTYNDNGSVTVSLQVTDAEHRTTTDTLTVTINNVAPTASVSGPSTLASGQSGTFNFIATDPSSVDQASNFTYDINWGDGTPDSIVVGSANISRSHIFTTNANNTVSVKVTDKDGGQSAAATTGVSITAPATVSATSRADPLNPGQTMLVVQGTAGNDVIELDHSQKKVNKVLVQTLTVMSNGVAIYSSTTPFSRIEVFANSGDDSVTHGGGFKYAVEEYGGAGNDTLKAGQSGDILVGGAGNDSLVSGAGNDIEIGGTGADKVVGDAGQDILIAGYTSYDNDPASLVAISAEWTSADAFTTRIAALQAGVGPGGSVKLVSDNSPNGTVFDDGVKDTLNGGGTDSDWLIYNITGGTVDKASGNATGDVVTDI